MTNEEKAKEIGQKFYFDTMNSNEAAYKGALQMAQWKEQQMIERAVRWMEDNINNYIVNDQYELPNGSMSRDWLKVKSEFFTDFKKSMEE